MSFDLLAHHSWGQLRAVDAIALRFPIERFTEFRLGERIEVSAFSAPSAEHAENVEEHRGEAP